MYTTKHKPRTQTLVFTCNARDTVNTEHNTHRIAIQHTIVQYDVSREQ